MLNKDPRQRINAKEALNHPWFNDKNAATTNNVHLDVSEGIANLNQEMFIDKKQMQD